MLTIAEIGQAHEGSLGIAHSYIDALSETGVDAIKWQMHIAEAESSEAEPFRVNFSYEDKNRMDYWKRMEFTFEQWLGIKSHCEKLGMEFICSPFSNAAVESLEKLGVKRYKIGSGEVSNFLMLEKIANTGKEVLLSSGMSSFNELDKTIKFLEDKACPISILQCTTAYPTAPESWGLNVIQELKNRYPYRIGFSDHSGDIYAGLAAAALGAEILEFHAVFDKLIFGPDSKASLTLNQIKSLVQGLNEIKLAANNPVNKSDNSSFSELKNIFEKSLAVNKDLSKGHIITIDDLEAKKPKGQGINTEVFTKIIGKKLEVNKKAWDFLKEEDIKS